MPVLFPHYERSLRKWRFEHDLAQMTDAETLRGLGIRHFTHEKWVDLSGIEPLTF